MYERGNVIQVFRCVSQANCDVLLWSEYAAIPLRPAQDNGNIAVPPGIPDWNRRAEANTGGGALLRLHRWPCELWLLCAVWVSARAYLRPEVQPERGRF